MADEYSEEMEEMEFQNPYKDNEDEVLEVPILVRDDMATLFTMLERSNLFSKDLWTQLTGLSLTIYTCIFAEKSHKFIHFFVFFQTIDEEITDDVVRVMTADHIKLLFPKIGHQIKFTEQRLRWLKNPLVKNLFEYFLYILL